MKFLAVVLVLCAALLLLHAKYTENVDRTIESEFAEITFQYNYSQHLWCVNAVRRNALPGQQLGGCWKSFEDARYGILHAQKK